MKPIIINPNRYNNIFQDGGAGNSILQNFTSTEFKLKIVEEAKELDNNTLVARKHGISEGAVRSWRKNEDKLSKNFFQILWQSRCHILVYFSISFEEIIFYPEILTPKVELWIF